MTEPTVPMTDEYLRAAILAAFGADSRTRSAGLRAGVLNGVVHLAGDVDSLATRSAAEELAKQVRGVRGVVNRINAPGAPSPARAVTIDLKP